MKLDYIQLHNFRQFYGTTPKIAFSADEKNVTVLHANNGSGKTALLNAFTWTLYESFTSGFKLEDQLVNKRALREADLDERITAWVEIKFEHDGKNYIIRREQEALRIDAEPGYQSAAENKVTLRWEAGDGNWRFEERVVDNIGRVLPKDLHNYFFFDGERIERIVQPDKKQQDEIKGAAKKLLGLEIIERSVHHLNEARKELESELKSIGSPQVKKELDEKCKLEDSLEIAEARNREIDQEKENHEELINEIEHRLSTHREVKEYQERREQLKELHKGNQEKIVETNKKLKERVSKNGYLAYISGLIDDFKHQIELMRTKGELPSGIKKQFVEDLLENAKCICGNELKKGSTAYLSVERWREQAGLADVEEKALSMGGEIRAYERRFEEFHIELRDLQSGMLSLRKDNSNIERELDDIAERLKSSPVEQISDLESRRQKAEMSIRELMLEQGGIERDIHEWKKRIQDIDEEISKLRANEQKQKIAQKRVKAAQEAHDRMKEMLGLYDKSFRFSLENKVKDLFSGMSLTPYKATLSESYSIKLQEEAGGELMDVAASQGESQILSLSFIGAIIDVVRDKQQRHRELGGVDAASYPVVMDSPFGALDQNYRKQIADNLPRIADQVVVLASQTQWRGEVAESMNFKVGKHYVMTYHTPRQDLEISDDVVINGTGYPLVKRSPNEFEFTEVLEVQ